MSQPFDPSSSPYPASNPLVRVLRVIAALFGAFALIRAVMALFDGDPGQALFTAILAFLALWFGAYIPFQRKRAQEAGFAWPKLDSKRRVFVGVAAFAALVATANLADDGPKESDVTAVGASAAMTTSEVVPSTQAPTTTAEIVPVEAAPPVVEEQPKNPEDMVPGVDYDPKDLFVLNLMVGKVKYTSEPEVIQAAENICTAIGNGTPVLNVQLKAYKSGYSAHDAGYLVGAAVNAYCPQYEYLLN